MVTDGRTALVWGGFSFPFGEDVLVPAVPVFGSRELAGEEEVRLGRTTTHLVVAAGPWRVYLPVDKAGRYPDVTGVVPRQASTVVVIDDRDAAELLDKLPSLPGADADHRPVTLSAERGGVVVRGGDAKADVVGEVHPGRSTATGPGVRAVVDRRIVARALTLGCRTVRFIPDKPVVFEGTDKILLTVSLDPVVAVGTDTDTNTNHTNTHNTERMTAVKHETNGHPPNGRHDPPAGDPPDLLAAAEELRVALGEALAKAGRLVAALKARQKEKKALANVYAGLKALNLGPGGQP